VVSGGIKCFSVEPNQYYSEPLLRSDGGLPQMLALLLFFLGFAEVGPYPFSFLLHAIDIVLQTLIHKWWQTMCYFSCDASRVAWGLSSQGFSVVTKVKPFGSEVNSFESRPLQPV